MWDKWSIIDTYDKKHVSMFECLILSHTSIITLNPDFSFLILCVVFVSYLMSMTGVRTFSNYDSLHSFHLKRYKEIWKK